MTTTPAPEHHRYTVKVGGETISDHIGWLHSEFGREEAPAVPLAVNPPKPKLVQPRKAEKPKEPLTRAEHKKARKEQIRQNHQHVRWDTPYDTHKVVDHCSFGHLAKRRREASIMAALEKRKRRVPMTPAELKAFKLKLGFANYGREFEGFNLRDKETGVFIRWERDTTQTDSAHV